MNYETIIDKSIYRISKRAEQLGFRIYFSCNCKTLYEYADYLLCLSDGVYMAQSYNSWKIQLYDDMLNNHMQDLLISFIHKELVKINNIKLKDIKTF